MCRSRRWRSNSRRYGIDTGEQGSPSSAVIASEAKQSILSFFFAPRDGLLRKACHRARISATRWLAKTVLASHPALQRLADLVEHLGILDRRRHGPGIAVGDLLDGAPQD